MKKSIRLLSIAFFVFFTSSLCAAPIIKDVAKGITFYQDMQTDKKLLINAVFIDLNVEGVRVTSDLAGGKIWGGDKNGRETIVSMVKRNNATVGLNGDYFPWTGDPLGVAIIDGELVSEPTPDSSSCAITNDNKFVTDVVRMVGKLTFPNRVSRQIDGINRPRETNQLVIYTPRYGESTKNKYAGTEVIAECTNLPLAVGKEMELIVKDVYQKATDSKIPDGCIAISAGGAAGWFLKENATPGSILKIRIDFRSAVAGSLETACDWTQVKNAMGAGPILLKNGEHVTEHGYFRLQGGHMTDRHPRTAIGVTADNKIIFVVVDGRQAYSKGVSTDELAFIMKDMGAVEAMNLDGGGSSTLVINGLIVNSPSDSAHRSVCNGWLAYGETDLMPMPNMTAYSLDANSLGVMWGNEFTPLTTEENSRVIWGTVSGGGFVDQMGKLYPREKTKAKIGFVYGPSLIDGNMTIGGTVE